MESWGSEELARCLLKLVSLLFYSNELRTLDPEGEARQCLELVRSLVIFNELDAVSNCSGEELVDYEHCSLCANLLRDYRSSWAGPISTTTEIALNCSRLWNNRRQAQLVDFCGGLGWHETRV